MSVSCVVEVGAGAPERVPADLLVAPCFEAERPLRGAVGRIDWRLCGHLSSLFEREVIAGRSGEVILLPTPGRLQAPRALLVGLGPRQAFRGTVLRDAVAHALHRAADLRAGVVAVAVPGEADSGLSSATLATAIVAGMVQALHTRPFALRLRLIAHPDQASSLRRGLADASPRAAEAGVALRITEPTSAEGLRPRSPRGTESSPAPATSHPVPQR